MVVLDAGAGDGASLHHHRAMPELAGLEREDRQTYTDFTGEIYLRQEGQGVLLGTYEQHSMPWSSTRRRRTSIQLLPDELERSPRFRGRASSTSRAGQAGIRRRSTAPSPSPPTATRWSARCGGSRILGPPARSWPASARAAASASCCRAGWPRATRARTSSPWTSPASGSSRRRSTRSRRCTENYRRRFRLAYPNEEMPAARPVRRSPIYDGFQRGRRDRRQIRLGERALVRAARACRSRKRRPIAAPTPTRTSRAEMPRRARAVGLYETHELRKYEFTGRGARAWLDRMFACRIPRPGGIGARADAELRPGASSATCRLPVWPPIATSSSARLPPVV